MSLVAIVGRPNVGKSTLFNRLVGERKAIVDATAGTTRDRHYGKTDWNGKEFSIIDTGGYTVNSEDIFEDEIRRQVLLAIDEADVILFLVEVRTGITDLDMLMADILRRTSKKVILVCNKVDNNDQIYSSHEFYALGLGDPFCISSMSGSGTGDLMDAILAALPAETLVEEEENLPHITIVGRPNVGKSSLLNAFAGEERSMVSDIAGTTRDVVDSVVEMNGHRFRFLDTAGLRRKSRVNTDLEYYSNVRTYQAIDRCHVALVLLDAQDPVTEQDKRLIGQVLERGKGLILVVNKWDLAPREEKVGDVMTKKLIEELPFAAHAPRVFISALSGRSLGKLPELILKVEENRRRRIATSELNKLVKEVLVFERMPGDGKGHSLKIYYCTQADGAPPAFIFFVNDSELCSKSFKRHLENLLREMADFSGVPIKIFMRNKI